MYMLPHLPQKATGPPDSQQYPRPVDRACRFRPRLRNPFQLRRIRISEMPTIQSPAATLPSHALTLFFGVCMLASELRFEAVYSSGQSASSLFPDRREFWFIHHGSGMTDCRALPAGDANRGRTVPGVWG